MSDTIDLTDCVTLTVTRLELMLLSRLAQLDGVAADVWLRSRVERGVKAQVDLDLAVEVQERIGEHTEPDSDQ